MNTRQRKPNRYTTRGEVTSIFIRRRNGPDLECLIDTEDLSAVIQYTWTRSSDGYARSNVANKLMHVLIMNPPHGLVIDHIHHKPLDNRKSELRIVPETVNAHNRKRTDMNIHWHGQSRKWRVRFCIEWRHVSFGLYADKSEAESVAEIVREKLRQGERVEDIESSVRASRPKWKTRDV